MDERIKFIVDMKNLSSLSKYFLIVCFTLPPDWEYDKSWIINKLKITDWQWRKVSQELREIGILHHDHKSNGREIKRKIKIDLSRLVNNTGWPSCE